jgi:hypothetical protein
MQLVIESLVEQSAKPQVARNAAQREHHDQREVALRFPTAAPPPVHLRETLKETYPSEGRSARSIEHLLNANAPVSNYNTTTYGRITFQRLPESSTERRTEKIVEDGDLQSRLESLCESLRSRY